MKYPNFKVKLIMLNKLLLTTDPQHNPSVQGVVSLDTHQSCQNQGQCNTYYYYRITSYYFMQLNLGQKWCYNVMKKLKLT